MIKLIVALFSLSMSAFAQEVTYRQSISGELLGLGFGPSVQYDYMFKHSARGFYDVRIGVGRHGFSSDYSGITLPHAMIYNFKKKHHFFELGVGGTLAHDYHKESASSSTTEYFLGPMIGHRSISPKGFQFRIYLYTFFAKDGSIFPLPGIGFGKVFRKK